MNKFKKALLALLLVPATFMLTACGQEPLVSIYTIEKTASDGVIDTYTITYTDGSTSHFTVRNGENAKDITFEDVWKDAQEKGYTGDYWQFLKDYLSTTAEPDSTVTNTNRALFSAVSIFAEHKVNEVTYTWLGGKVNTPSTSVGAGAGVIYKMDDNGNAYIITNYHVLYNKDSLNTNKIGDAHVYLYGASNYCAYKTNNGKQVYDSNNYPVVEYGADAIECEYVGGSMTYDIAVLRVKNSEILKSSQARPVDLADGYTVGETVVAIGNPEAEGISATQGIVSVDSEYLTMTAADETTSVSFRVMRVDCAINGGNSGGGLFNRQGKLIGIVNAKIVDEEIENMGYAIPVELATNIADNLIDYNEINSSLQLQQFKLGIATQTMNSHAVLDVDTARTAIVEDVIVASLSSGSVASKMGMRIGDQLVSMQINDEEAKAITRNFIMHDALINVRVGDRIYITVERDGVQSTLPYTVTASDITSTI